MPRPTLRSCFIAVAVAIVGLHLAAVTLAALPPNRYSDAARGQTAYLDPYFTQNWRLFAPTPISEDRSLRFQGAYVDADGRQARTPWVDWTAVELDLVRHRLVGGRAGYVSNKLVPSLRAGTPAASLRGFLRYERAAAQLGTDVLESRFPQLDLTAVRYSVRRQAVVPFAARGGSQAEREAVRPAATDEVGGWRRPMPGSAAERAAVRDFDRRHR